MELGRRRIYKKSADSAPIESSSSLARSRNERCALLVDDGMVSRTAVQLMCLNDKLALISS